MRTFTAILNEAIINGVVIVSENNEDFLLFNPKKGLGDSSWGYENERFLPSEGITNFHGYTHNWPAKSRFIKNLKIQGSIIVNRIGEKYELTSVAAVSYKPFQPNRG